MKFICSICQTGEADPQAAQPRTALHLNGWRTLSAPTLAKKSWKSARGQVIASEPVHGDRLRQQPVYGRPRNLEFDRLGRYRNALSANRQIGARDARNSDRFVFMSGIHSAILALFQRCAFARSASGNAPQPTRYHHVRSCFPVHRAGFLFPRCRSPSNGSAHLCLVGYMEWVMGGPPFG